MLIIVMVFWHVRNYSLKINFITTLNKRIASCLLINTNHCKAFWHVRNYSSKIMLVTLIAASKEIPGTDIVVAT